MPGFLIPLAGLALGALGRLMQQRRASRNLQAMAGAAHGTAINTQPQGPPTNAVSQAATTSPMPPTTQGPSQQRQDETNAAIRQSRQNKINDAIRAQRAKRQQTGDIPPQTPGGMEQGTTGQPQQADQSGLAARMGRESVARSRKRNLQQQAALSTAATSR